MLRKCAVLAVLGLALSGWAVAGQPDRNAPVTILTQNMDDGTDFTYVIGALLGNPADVPPAVDLTYAELQASNIPGRVNALATEIAARKPEILALQEASLWRFGPTTETATTVLWDQIALLLSALDKAGVPYDVVAVNHLTDLAAPGDLIGGALRITDRNALLVRSDLRPPQFHLSNVHARTFAAGLPFAGTTLEAGWISIDVHMGNRQFRVVTTHLQGPIPGVDAATLVQEAQAAELLRDLRNLQVPVVICGDFNSDANGGSFVDATPTAALIAAAGYPEVWPATHGVGDPGLTWPYFLEDQFPAPPFFLPFPPQERIDLFFSRGMDASSSALVIVPLPADPAAPLQPLFASDHAGVIAVFQP
jgi:endonuclease/exonuclease/phosphatase family metal-dependent hydrolase